SPSRCSHAVCRRAATTSSSTRTATSPGRRRRRSRKATRPVPEFRPYDPEVDPDPNFKALMDQIDRLPKSLRILVYEFGWKPVREMLDDLPEDQRRNIPWLRSMLVRWRERRQEEWLATDF